MIRIVVFVFLTLHALFAAHVQAADLRYTTDIRPILQSRCMECHGVSEQSGNVNFDAIESDKSAAFNRKTWRRALAQLKAGDMPPAGEAPLEPDQKKKLLDWMQRTLAVIDENDPANRDPGPAVIRRLTLVEYNNTVRDLLGIEFDAAAVGITEDSGEGNTFGNLAVALELPPALLEKYFNSADQILDRFFGTELSSTVNGRIQDQARASREKLFGLKPNEWRRPDYVVAPPKGVEPREAAKQLIGPVMRRAYRGQATTQDTERLLVLFDRATAQEKSYGDSIRLMLKAILVSPKFLFRLEPNPAGAKPGENIAVSDHELAVRLSYFLWSSMPDDELLDLAERNELSRPEVLEKQIARLLADKKARALTDNFAVPWLQIHKLPVARPSTEFFPEFNANIRQAMFEETTTFFDMLRQQDRSLLELLSADYTYANEELAKYYGLTEVKGKEPQRVELKAGDHRGGLLGMGSVLAVTSHTSRTSPTLRGKWILEVLFGTPPPPPPANVSQIKEERRGKKEVETFREKLAQHAHDKSCAGCHRKMDPLGFALDNFDAVGRWRTTVGDLKLDVSGELPTGEKLNGSADLQKVLLARKDEFIRHLSSQMLMYALGRELDNFDDCPLQRITAKLQAEDYRFSTLVREIVLSYPFRNRRSPEEPRTK